ncbi:sugar transferase [Imperialibacter roseus]|uniref:Sugar transferase n=1 Tax=Imperialibacter roseus TaxID=1324217 RepID=A0ABZ0ILP0_9BACT|nr:sugar transferase [Imperialibacter roseus]WOK05363.1 sugar transferase [Imperialibacter roseus]
MLYRKYFKRLIDLFLGVFAIILLSPLFLMMAIIIPLDSRGPVFYLQDRLGLGKKTFRLYKFRTMTHVDRQVHKQVFGNDPEVTSVGKLLRRLKIDELPQIINVIRGEMSIVGPRPCLASISHLFDKNTEFRFLAKPGLTSLAAIKGSIYLSWGEKWVYDRLYVAKSSFLLDVKIILNTFLVIIFGEKKFLEHPDSSLFKLDTNNQQVTS